MEEKSKIETKRKDGEREGGARERRREGERERDKQKETETDRQTKKEWGRDKQKDRQQVYKPSCTLDISYSYSI